MSNWNTLDLDDMPENADDDDISFEVVDDEPELDVLDPVEPEEEDEGDDDQTLQVADEDEAADRLEEEEEDEESASEKSRKSRSQRRIQELVREKNEREAQLQQMQEQLQERNQEVKNLRTQTNEERRTYVNNEKEMLTSQIQRLRDDYRDALDQADSQRAAELVDQLQDKKLRLDKIRQMEAKIPENAPEEQAPEVPHQNVDGQQQQQQQQRQEIAEPMQNWMDDNTWFNQDRAKTALAIGVNQDLLDEGYNPNKARFYEELDERLGEYMPEKKKTKRPKKAGVSGSSRKSPKASGKNTVRLSAAQKMAAEKLGVPLKEYAKMVKRKEDQGDSKYFTI